MMDKTEFKKRINGILAGAGFVRKASAWHRPSTDVIVVIGLQKSDFAEKFYFNFGLWLCELGEADWPKENKCHINGRLTGLFPDAVSLIDEASTLDEGSEARLPELLVFLGNEVLPFCLTCRTLEGVRDHLASGRFSRMLVTRDAKDLLLSC